MANASGPKWRRQQKTESDIFDDDGEAPESPAAARALRMLNSKHKSEAPTTKPSIRPNPVHAAATLTTSAPLPSTSPFAHQEIDERPLHPHEHSLNSFLARIQLRIRQNHYANAGGAQDWDGDVAQFQRLVSSAYGKGALGWCEIAQCTIEEERASQARIVLLKDVEIGDLRGRIGQLRGECEGLEREIRNLVREVAELKGWCGGFGGSA